MKNSIVGYTVVNRSPLGVGMPLTERGSLLVASTPAMMSGIAKSMNIPGTPEPVYFWHMVPVLMTGDGYAMTRDAMKNFNQALRDNQAELSKYHETPLKEVSVPADAGEHWLFDYRLNLPPEIAAAVKQEFIKRHASNA